MLNRRQLVSLAASASLSMPGAAQDHWPTRPIRILNPGAPGGLNDLLSRSVSEPMAKRLGQPMVIESKAGAGGVIASQYLLQQPADGYTILSQHNAFVTAPLLSPGANYDPFKDFVPLSLKAYAPLLLIAHPSMPPALAQFVAFARANPGKLEWCTAALGGVGHLACEVFHNMAGIKGMVKVAYSGVSLATQALVSGEVKYGILSMTGATTGLVQEGRLRVLGVASPQRTALVAGVPAIAEVVPGFEAEAWYGFLARAGTPPHIVQKLSDAIASAVTQPGMAEKFNAVGVGIAKSGRSEFAEVMRRDYEKWSSVIKSNNIKLET